MNLHFGYRPQGNWRFAGILDEVTLYNRALTPDEIAAIAAALEAGKCRPPAPPFIATQPVDLSIFEGETARFEVQALSENAMNYQWNFKGDPLSFATNAYLILSNASFADAGSYAVIISNSVGSATSSLATLTIKPPPVCAPAPAGLVAWWPLEGNAADVTGTASGTILGNPAFVPAKVRQGMNFDKIDDAIRIPASTALDVGMGEGFTIELWIKIEDPTTSQPILEWNDGVGHLGLNLWTGFAGEGSLSANIVDTAGASHLMSTSSGIVSNRFIHIAPWQFYTGYSLAP
jgi:hypothetical protein